MRFIPHQKRLSHGFTLIESLIALVVLAITCSIAFPSFQKARQTILVANQSAALTSLFQLAQSRAVKENRPYIVSLVSDNDIDCIIAKEKAPAMIHASASQSTQPLNCHQTKALMVRLDKHVTVKQKGEQGWKAQTDGDLFSIDFRTQRPNINLTLGLGAKETKQPDYLVQVRQYLGFGHCKNKSQNDACS